MDKELQKTVEAIKVDCDFPSRVVERGGQKFLVSADVLAETKEELQEKFRAAEGTMNDFDANVKHARAELQAKIDYYANKLAQLI